MDYITRYKKKSQRNGKSQREKIINEGTRNFEKHLETSPSAFDVPLTTSDETCVSENTRIVRCLINNITLNDQRNLDEKYIHIPKGIKVRIGCYTKWDGQDWLLIFREHNSLDTHRTYVMRKCSQVFRYEHNETVYDIPVCVSNLTLYSDGMADTKHTSIPDSKREIKFGLNNITKNIQLGTRFMLTKKTVFRITHMNDFEHNDGHTGADGVVTAIGLQTTLNGEDDVVENIAHNPSKNVQVADSKDNIVGNSFIAIGCNSKFTTKKSSSSTSWKLKEDYSFAKIVSQNTKECVIKIDPNGRVIGEVIILELLSGGSITDRKEIKINGFT